MSDRAQRWSSVLLGGGAVALSGWLALDPRPYRPAPAPRGSVAEEGGTRTRPSLAASDAGVVEDASTSAMSAEDGLNRLGRAADGGLEMPLLDPSRPGRSDDEGGLAGRSSDGGVPRTAPRSMRLGVVLVAYAGAEGATRNAASKADALARAQRLATEARADFKSAVKAGDSGSSEDIGRVPRGVLDPTSESAVFSLAPGDVTDVLETPRGYWIVKRIE